MLLRRYKNRRATKLADLNVEPVAEQVPVNETPDLLTMTVEELQAFAAEREIDLGRATSQEGIRKKIQEALEEQPE